MSLTLNDSTDIAFFKRWYLFVPQWLLAINASLNKCFPWSKTSSLSVEEISKRQDSCRYYLLIFYYVWYLRLFYFKKCSKIAWRSANLDITADLFFDFWPNLSMNIINYDIKSSCLIVLNPLLRNKTSMERQSEHPTRLLCTTRYSRCIWLSHYLCAARARGNRAADSKMIGKWPTFPARGLVDRAHIVFVLLLALIFVESSGLGDHVLWDYKQQTISFRLHRTTTGMCI